MNYVTPSANFTVSAFGDEVNDDLAVQLDVLGSEGLRHLEFRGAWGQNVLDLENAQWQRARALIRERDFLVSEIGSPIGKSKLEEPPKYEIDRLERAMACADVLGTRLIRIFSYYVPAGEAWQHRTEVLDRIASLTDRANRHGVLLLLENERGIYGDVPERCQDILSHINSPTLRMAFDPANFVLKGIAPRSQAWQVVGPYVQHIHIKDAHSGNGHECPAGQGDGQILELLQELSRTNYHGYLTVEPHLALSGRLGGFSGDSGMRVAIAALSGLLERLPASATPA